MIKENNNVFLEFTVSNFMQVNLSQRRGGLVRMNNGFEAGGVSRKLLRRTAELPKLTPTSTPRITLGLREEGGTTFSFIGEEAGPLGRKFCSPLTR